MTTISNEAFMHCRILFNSESALEGGPFENFLHAETGWSTSTRAGDIGTVRKLSLDRVCGRSFTGWDEDGVEL